VRLVVVACALAIAACLTACSGSDSISTTKSNASCAWGPHARRPFANDAPHVCLYGDGPRYRLVAWHFKARSAVRVDLRAEPLDRVVVLSAGPDGRADVYIRAGGLVPVTGTGPDGRAFAAQVTASGGPIK
jgi:hypothetical protein